MMNRNALLTGAGLGALLMFISDPQGGGRRRALVRDKAMRAANVSRRAVAATAEDMTNRTRGIAAVTRRMVSGRQIDESGRHEGAPPLDVFQRRWAPATRALVGMTAAAAAALGVAAYARRAA